MRVRVIPGLVAALLLPVLPTMAYSSGSSKDPEPLDPCTVQAPSGTFFDLNSINLINFQDDKKTKARQSNESWHARGYDYGANFTLNICGPVVEPLTDVVGVEQDRWRNVSGFYEKDGKTYSIGQNNADFIFRGKKLVLNYTDGSPCTPRSRRRGIVADRPGKSRLDGDWDDERDEEPQRLKNTVIMLLCERDPPLKSAPAVVSFVSTDADECSYFFEARSTAACPTATIQNQNQALGPSSVFGVITIIAILAYLIGGVVYQRTVMHQRGWRQLPNYALWAGIFTFFADILIILASSCSRFIPGRARKSYTRMNGNGSMNGHYGSRRSSENDDENRLIDQLDEEWED